MSAIYRWQVASRNGSSSVADFSISWSWLESGCQIVTVGHQIFFIDMQTISLVKGLYSVKVSVTVLYVDCVFAGNRFQLVQGLESSFQALSFLICLLHNNHNEDTMRTQWKYAILEKRFCDIFCITFFNCVWVVEKKIVAFWGYLAPKCLGFLYCSMLISLLLSLQDSETSEDKETALETTQ